MGKALRALQVIIFAFACSSGSNAHAFILLEAVDGPLENVQIQTISGPAQAAQIGQEIPPGSVIRTGNVSSVDLRLADGSLVRIGQNSQYSVISYQQNLAGFWFWSFQLSVGTIRALVSKAEKKGWIKFKLSTPSGTIGVRGTDFLVRVGSGPQKTTVLETLSGLVVMGGRGHSLNNSDGLVQVPAGYRAQIQMGQAIPADAEKFFIENAALSSQLKGRAEPLFLPPGAIPNAPSEVELVFLPEIPNHILGSLLTDAEIRTLLRSRILLGSAHEIAQAKNEQARNAATKNASTMIAQKQRAGSSDAQGPVVEAASEAMATSRRARFETREELLSIVEAYEQALYNSDLNFDLQDSGTAKIPSTNVLIGKESASEYDSARVTVFSSRFKFYRPAELSSEALASGAYGGDLARGTGAKLIYEASGTGGFNFIFPNPPPEYAWQTAAYEADRYATLSASLHEGQERTSLMGEYSDLRGKIYEELKIADASGPVAPISEQATYPVKIALEKSETTAADSQYCTMDQDLFLCLIRLDNLYSNKLTQINYEASKDYSPLPAPDSPTMETAASGASAASSPVSPSATSPQSAYPLRQPASAPVEVEGYRICIPDRRASGGERCTWHTR